MAIDLSTTGYINHGSSSTLEDFTVGTILAWVYIGSSVPDGYVFSKWTGTIDEMYMYFDGNTNKRIECSRGRATTTLRVRSAASTLQANKWQFVGFTFNSAGADTDQKLYWGDLTTTVAEVSYLDRRVGSGTLTAGSTGNAWVGNRNDSPGTWAQLNNTRVGFVAVYPTILTLQQIFEQQFNLTPVVDGARLFVQYGLGALSEAVDWSGNANHGTVTNGSLAGHIPICPWIYSPTPNEPSGDQSSSITDIAAGSDAVSFAAAVGLTETGSGTDTPTIRAALAVTDTGAGIDVETIRAALAVTDTGAGMDAQSILARLSIGDTGAGTDSQSILASLGITDLGSGTETPAILVNLDVSDTAAGLDNLVAQALIAITDAASTSEALSILSGVLISIADTGVGADTVSQILAALSLADQGSGSDTLTGRVQLSVSDAGASTESVVVTIAGRVIVKITFALGMGAVTTVLAAGRIGSALAAGHIDASFTAGRVDASISVGQILVDQFQ